jgi:hypothetical protein
MSVQCEHRDACTGPLCIAASERLCAIAPTHLLCRLAQAPASAPEPPAAPAEQQARPEPEARPAAVVQAASSSSGQQDEVTRLADEFTRERQQQQEQQQQQQQQQQEAQQQQQRQQQQHHGAVAATGPSRSSSSSRDSSGTTADGHDTVAGVTGRAESPASAPAVQAASAADGHVSAAAAAGGQDRVLPAPVVPPGGLPSVAPGQGHAAGAISAPAGSADTAAGARAAMTDQDTAAAAAAAAAVAAAAAGHNKNGRTTGQANGRTKVWFLPCWSPSAAHHVFPVCCALPRFCWDRLCALARPLLPVVSCDCTQLQSGELLSSSLHHRCRAVPLLVECDGTTCAGGICGMRGLL